MDVDLDHSMARLQAFWSTLTDASAENMRTFAAECIRYRDPLMDSKGIDAVVSSMRKWFTDVDDLKFEMKISARNGQVAFQHWIMTARPSGTFVKTWKIEGVSKITFDEQGKIVDQVDYWNTSPFMRPET
jgi:steroid delta-isomerase